VRGGVRHEKLDEESVNEAE
jgi:hypothetical protein